MKKQEIPIKRIVRPVKPILPKTVPSSISGDYTLSTKWMDLSKRLNEERVQGKSSSLNKELILASNSDAGSPLEPLFHLWMADNLCIDGDYKASLKPYESAIKTSGKSGAFHPHINTLPHVLDQYAKAASYIKNSTEALSAWKQLAKLKDKDIASMLSAAKYFESVGNITEAAFFYNEAGGNTPVSASSSIGQLAKRALLRMDNNELFYPSAAQIKEILITALAQKNSNQLEKLLSKSHCSVTIGAGHKHFIEDTFRADLISELIAGNGEVVRTHMGMGEKYYFYMNGFNGKLLNGEVGFLITKCAYGWQWSGVILPNPPEKLMRDISGPVRAANNIPLPFPIKAPWPAGTSFMAGGLSVYILQQLEIATLALMAFPIGIIAAAALTEYYAAQETGFGLRGFYYNGGSTHDDDDYYAIDFSRYKKYVPYFNSSGGTPVLSVADGMVSSLRGNISSGDSSLDNNVVISHLEPNTSTYRYYSRYLHLSGPNQLRISMGCNVLTGSRLGLMNDTGNSVIDHLHFSIHDRNANNQSIRPSPMGGVTLEERDSGKIVISSNRLSNPPLPDNAAFVSEQAIPNTISPNQTYNASVTMRNTGPNTWSSNYLLIGPSGFNKSEIKIGRTVAPGEEIQISLSIYALFSGDYNYRWQMARSSTGKFGTASPMHKIKVENANGTSCASLAIEIDDAEAELTLFQEMLQHTNDKPSVIRSINKAMARIHTLNTQQERLGC